MPIDKLLSPGRKGFAELGHIGLKSSAGQIRQEQFADLTYPKAAKTYHKMSYDPTIASALTVLADTIRRLEWEVVVPEGASQEKANFIKECMDDLDRPWKEYINEFLRMLVFGYNVNEKVFKRRKGNSRRNKSPSKYNDGKIGWKKLPSRDQQSLTKWLWDSSGRDLIGVKQNLSHVEGDRFSNNMAMEVNIPRSKFMLFRHNAQLDSPEGLSPLRHCYLPWRYKSTIEEYEAIGISRDMAGMPVVGLPPEYMSPNASGDKKEIFEYMQQVVANINANEQAGLVFPRFIDPDSKQDLFSFELLGISGGKQYETDVIVKRYEHRLLMTFLADVLLMGGDSAGSYALSDNKLSLMAVKIGAVLDQLTATLNRDLVGHTFVLNSWDDEVLPEINYKPFDTDSLDDIGKFVQRVVSVGAMEVDQGLSNKLRDLVELEEPEEGKPLREALLPETASKSGEGNKTAGEGTAKKPSGGNKDTSNRDS